MQLPINCPICRSIMLTEFKGAAVIIKSCRKNISHSMVFVADIDTSELLEIELQMSAVPEVQAEWDFKDQSLTIITNDSVPLPLPPGGTCPPKKARLPFFQPDLSDCRKLIDKLKTYLVFS